MSKKLGTRFADLVVGFVAGAMFMLAFTANNAEAAYPEPLYEQLVVTPANVEAGDTVCSIGMSNVKQMGDKFFHPDITYNNMAEGGKTLVEWSDPNFSGWNGGGVCDIFHVNTVIRGTNISGSAYVSKAMTELYQVLDNIENKFNPKQVVLWGLHGEPFQIGTGSKQDHDDAWNSGLVADQASKAVNPYDFSLIHGPYVWANESSLRDDGLFWGSDDFTVGACASGRGPDYLHLCAQGNIKHADLHENYYDVSLGNDPGPDPDPDPDPPGDTRTVCELEGTETQIRLITENGEEYCQARYPNRKSLMVGDDPGPDPDPDPTQLEQCYIDNSWATQCRIRNDACQCR